LHWTHKGKAGAGLLAQLHGGAGRTADFLFADLDRSTFVIKSDAKADGRTMAGLVLANILISAVVGGFATTQLPLALVATWGIPALVSLLVSLLLVAKPGANTGSIHNTERLAVLLGLIWASVPPLWLDASGPDLRMIGAAFSFAMAGIGSLAFSRVPSAAILHCGLIAGATSLTALKLGGSAGLAGFGLSIVYGLAVAVIILNNHRRNLHLVTASLEQRRQSEIIALLLNDFEQGTADWLWEADQSLSLTYASPQLARLLGIADEALAGMVLRSLADNSGGGQRGWEEFLAKLNSHQPVVAHDLDLAPGGRLVHARITARPLFGAEGTFLGYRGVGRDITIEHQALEELVRAKESAEQANAAKSQFLAVMSHELKTPLNAIVGFSELLASPQADFLGDETRAEHLNTILESSRHLQNLINDILDATRIEKGTMVLAEQEADAAELVEVAVKLCRDMAERGDITIIARVMEGVELRGDITRLKQILINLLTNAVKFSTPGGFVNVGFERQGKGIAFTVRDSGVGMSEPDMARVFEPFVQADAGTARRFSGMGLGLSIARRLARLHGGDVSLESELGAGTTARLTLPEHRVTWPEVGHSAIAEVA
jgi:PAS domain S-box-containing protein